MCLTMDLCEVMPRGRGRPRVTDDPFEQSKHIRCLIYRVYDGRTVAEVAVIMRVSKRTVVYWTRLALSYIGYPEIQAIREVIAQGGITL